MGKHGNSVASATKTRLWDLVEERFGELIRICSDLIEIPSPNPPGDTTAVAGYVSAELDRLGLPVQAFAPRQDRPNVVAALGDEDGPHLLLNGHLDHFPPAAQGWDRDPYRAEVRDGRLYGVGVTDMRAGLASSLFLARLLVDASIPMAGRLTLVFSSDEESGGRWGTEWLLQNVPSLRADGCLVGDQCGTDVVGAGEKGLCWLRVQTSGQRAHGAYGSARSAIRRLSHATSVLYSLEALTARLPSGMGHRAEDPRELVERVTVNVGTVRGGESPNLVADEAMAEVDIRLPYGFTVDGVVREVTSRLEREDCVARVELGRHSDPSLTDPSTRILRATVANSEAVLGTPSLPVVRVGASDARLFRHQGIPTVVFGPAPSNLGGGDEYVELEELKKVALVHAGVVLDFLNVDGAG